jgi:2-keto-myo-inositol isomerase
VYGPVNVPQPYSTRYEAHRELVMKSSLNQDTLKNTATDAVIRIANKTRYDAIEFAQDKVESSVKDASLTRYVRLIEDQEIGVASVQGPEFFNLLGENDFASVTKRAKVLADVASEVGTNVLVPVPSFVTSEDVSMEKVESSTVSSLEKLAKVCGDDINLGVEFLGFRNSSLNTLQNAIRVINKVDLPNVGLTIDTFHMYISESKVSDLGKIGKEKIFLVHVNDSEPGDLRNLTDSNRLFLGEGVIDLEHFRDSLVSLSYDGYVSIELLRPEYWDRDPEQVAREGRKGLRKIFKV